MDQLDARSSKQNSRLTRNLIRNDRRKKDRKKKKKKPDNIILIPSGRSCTYTRVNLLWSNWKAINPWLKPVKI